MAKTAAEHTPSFRDDYPPDAPPGPARTCVGACRAGMAEEAGFEPAVGLPTTAFKAVPIGRSGTPPARHAGAPGQSRTCCRPGDTALRHPGLEEVCGVVHNRGVTDYRLAPAVTARLLGMTMLLMGALVALATVGVAVANLHTVFLLVPVVVVLVAVVGLIAWSSAWVVRLTEDGYQVRRIRSAGVQSARWREVEDMVATTVAETPCVVLRLRDGGTTTIPLGALHTDTHSFTRTVAEHLNRAHGLRKLG